MKLTESKNTATQVHTKKEDNRPFFSQEGQEGGVFTSEWPFFASGESSAGHFFNPSLSAEGVSKVTQSPHIQAKMGIGAPDDKYEHEADAMADQVLQKMASSEKEPSIQGKCAECAAEEQEEGINAKLQQGREAVQRLPDEEDELKNHAEKDKTDSGAGLAKNTSSEESVPTPATVEAEQPKDESPKIQRKSINNLEGRFKPIIHSNLGSTIQRVAATPTKDLTQDPSKLKITTVVGIIEYYEFIRKEENVAVHYTSDTWNSSSKWLLYDSKNQLVNTNDEMGGGKYEIAAEILRNHIDKKGVSAFGRWRLRYEKGDYFDEINFYVSQKGGPAQILTDAETSASFFNIRELPGENSKVLGTLTGIKTPVTVSDKAYLDDIFWYKITLQAPIDKLVAGTQGLGQGRWRCHSHALEFIYKPIDNV